MEQLWSRYRCKLRYTHRLRDWQRGRVHWTAPWHDVVRLPTEAAYDACDLSGHTVLAPPNPNQGRYASSTEASYYFECDESLAGQTIYVACSLHDHCARGQKLKIRVSAAVRAYDPTTGDPLIHVTSLARIMALMGHRVDSQGGAHLDRGYQTEALANKTLELVWCLEAHCPQSAQDWDPTATHDSCIADVNNLAGFLSRKRPTPQISHARAYYATALDHFHNHCPTLGYLAMLSPNNKQRDRCGCNRVLNLLGMWRAAIASGSSGGQLLRG